MHAPVKSGDIHREVHGAFNSALATKITNWVGTMWAAYMFCLLALISLPAAILSHDPIIIVAWIAQTFLQLVLLPIIIVGQNIQTKFADHRAELDHQILTEVLAKLQALGTSGEAHQS